MSIIGLTDKPVLRRDGKIRAGLRDEASNKLENTEHFLLHDAPALQAVLGDTATEIFFTVHSDIPEDFMTTDLRFYNKSQLMCLSCHNAPDANGNSMGQVAAYYGVGAEVHGLKQTPFPGRDRARLRVCNYKSCVDYVGGKCSEHMFLDVVVPQCSMGAVFTLDSTSINAILNAHSTFAKAWTRYAGKLSGQIFRMYKKPGKIQYQKKDGSTGNRDAPMVFFDMVNFEEYETRFKDSIRPEDWLALMSMRMTRSESGALGYGGHDSRARLESSSSASPAPQIGHSSGTDSMIAAAIDETDPVKERADHPSILPYFEELAALLGREATAEVRYSTMKNHPTVEAGIDYLKNKIRDQKKKMSGQEEKPAAKPEPTPKTKTVKGEEKVVDNSAGDAGSLY